MYTLEEIKILRGYITALQLETPELWEMLTDEELQKWCNGCGPESAPEIVRKGLSALLKRYECAFAIHDVDYMFSDKTVADSRMRDNMIKIWEHDFGFWRYFSKAGLLNRFVVIPAAYTAVAAGGKEAYKEAQKGGGI